MYDTAGMEYVQVERDGKKLYLPDLRCSNGHLDLWHAWRACDVCRYACVHYDCRTCGDVVRDPDHEHRA